MSIDEPLDPIDAVEQDAAARSGEVIELDLNKVRLLGYEFVVDKLVDAAINGLIAGDAFTPVHVARVDDQTYILLPPHGGHHRAVSHFIENRKLKCIVVNPDDPVPGYQKKWRFFIDGVLRGDLGELKPIGETIINDDDGKRFGIHTRRHPKYKKPS